MKFDCDWRRDRRRARRQALLDRNTQWHTVYAWTPTKVAPNDCRWMENIERRFVVTYLAIDDETWWCTGYWKHRACRSAT